MATKKGVINTCLAIFLDTVYAYAFIRILIFLYSFEYSINVKFKILYTMYKMYIIMHDDVLNVFFLIKHSFVVFLFVNVS